MGPVVAWPTRACPGPSGTTWSIDWLWETVAPQVGSKGTDTTTWSAMPVPVVGNWVQP